MEHVQARLKVPLVKNVLAMIPLDATKLQIPAQTLSVTHTPTIPLARLSPRILP